VILVVVQVVHEVIAMMSLRVQGVEIVQVEECDVVAEPHQEVEDDLDDLNVSNHLTFVERIDLDLMIFNKECQDNKDCKGNKECKANKDGKGSKVHKGKDGNGNRAGKGKDKDGRDNKAPKLPTKGKDRLSKVRKVSKASKIRIKVTKVVNYLEFKDRNLKGGSDRIVISICPNGVFSFNTSFELFPRLNRNFEYPIFSMRCSWLYERSEYAQKSGLQDSARE